MHVNPVKVTRGRTTVVQVVLGYDVTEDTYSSEIRVQRDSSSPLIATWVVTKHPTRKKVLLLTIDNAVSAPIAHQHGWMDIKRVTGGEPVNVFENPISVIFVDAPTA